MKNTMRQAVEMLLDGDQAGLTRLASRLSDAIRNRFACPECGHAGPHDDNGRSGEDFALCCSGCGEVFYPQADLDDDV